MKKKLLIGYLAGALMGAVVFSACSSKIPQTIQDGSTMNKQATSYEGDPMLLGPVNREGLQTAPFKSWFEETYTTYQPRLSALGGVSKALKGVEVVVFMGTWCTDSQLEVPQFYRILDVLKFEESNLKVYAVDNHPDRNKTTPGGEHKLYNIEFVPTFIFMRDGKELGRIVEYPQKSLEADMAGFLTRKD